MEEGAAMTTYDNAMTSLSEAVLSAHCTLDEIDVLLSIKGDGDPTPELEVAYFHALETLLADIAFMRKATSVARPAIRAYIKNNRPSAP